MSGNESHETTGARAIVSCERMFVPCERRRDYRVAARTVQSPAQRRGGNLEWAEMKREERRAYQREGRRRAKQGDPLHEAGCMLYWAEGTKDRNVLKLANSDVNLVRFFHRFLVTCFDLSPIDFRGQPSCLYGQWVVNCRRGTALAVRIGPPTILSSKALRRCATNFQPGFEEEQAAVRRMHAAGPSQHTHSSAHLRRGPRVRRRRGACLGGLGESERLATTIRPGLGRQKTDPGRRPSVAAGTRAGRGLERRLGSDLAGPYERSAPVGAGRAK